MAYVHMAGPIGISFVYDVVQKIVHYLCELVVGEILVVLPGIYRVKNAVVCPADCGAWRGRGVVGRI